MTTEHTHDMALAFAQGSIVNYGRGTDETEIQAWAEVVEFDAEKGMVLVKCVNGNEEQTAEWPAAMVFEAN